MTDPRILGTALDYDTLRKLIALRRQELGLSQLAADDLAGVQTGYTGKLECGLRHFGDVSLGAVLGALGLELAVVRTAGTHRSSVEASKASAARHSLNRKNIGAKGGLALAQKTQP